MSPRGHRDSAAGRWSRRLLLAALVALAIPANATDDQSWLTVAIDLPAHKNWTVTATQNRRFEGFRYEEGFLVSTGFNVRRRLESGKSLVGGYRRRVRERRGVESIEHRWIAAALFRPWQVAGRRRVDLRLRSEARVFEGVRRSDELRLRLRLRLRGETTLAGRSLQPFVAAELFGDPTRTPLVDRIRTTSGVRLPVRSRWDWELGLAREDFRERRPVLALTTRVALRLGKRP